MVNMVTGIVDALSVCLGVLLLGIIPGYVMRLAEMAASMFVF
ncbi:hypothetical protein ES703_105934 [subsurface metagenome]